MNGWELQAARIRRWVTVAAGGWGLDGPMIRRPPSAPLAMFTGIRRVPIRPGEGTAAAIVPGSGTVQLALGPQALTTWYLTYVAISTTTGANDTSTCQAQVGAFGAGINPSGTAYQGGGDVISLGGRALKPGEYVVLVWSGARPGDQAIATCYGVQDILV